MRQYVRYYNGWLYFEARNHTQAIEYILHHTPKYNETFFELSETNELLTVLFASRDTYQSNELLN